MFGRETNEDRQRAERWGQWLREREPLAIASTALGVFSLLELGALLVFGVVGIVLGVMGLKRLARATGEPSKGHRLAWTGIVTSALSLLIAGYLYLSPVER